MTGVSEAHHRRRRGFLASGLALTAILAATLTAGPAQAVPGITDVTEETPSYSFGPATSRTKRATCPAGTRVIGGGGGMLGDPINDGLVVTQMQPVRPLFGQDFYEVTVNDPTGTLDDWGARATAVCAPALAGYQIVMTESSQDDSESTKNTQAACPEGKALLSAGAAASFSAPAEVALQFAHAYAYGGDAVVPDKTDVFIAENAPTSADWDFIVGQSICAD